MTSRKALAGFDDLGRCRPARVAMLSVHTSPLHQPGAGDAGGLNVYVVEVSRRLAAAGVAVEIFTRAAGHERPTVGIAPGVTVRHLDVGPGADVSKLDLPAQLCAMTASLLRTESDWGSRRFDLIHSHYWLSGQVGAVAADHWGLPLVHSMHTMALVKNSQLADGDVPEPQLRILGERQVVAAADRLLANTDDEAADLVSLYGADPECVEVVHPGVDLEMFCPGDRSEARMRVGLPGDRPMLLFVGRIQPLKAPDVFLSAVAALTRRVGRGERGPIAVVCGGPSGAGPERLVELRELAAELGIAEVVRFEPPTSRKCLADWYRAADIVCVPSYSESFGLVALEAQACGRPVIAADIGGLRTSVASGRSGILMPDHDGEHWAVVLDELLADRPRLADMGRCARSHAERFSWSSTAATTLAAYASALRLRRRADDRRGRTG